jgi:hypothetical protein
MIESIVKCCATVTIIGISHTVNDVPTGVCRYWQKAKVQGHGVFRLNPNPLKRDIIVSKTVPKV